MHSKRKFWKTLRIPSALMSFPLMVLLWTRLDKANKHWDMANTTFSSTISENLELCGDFPSHRYSSGTGVDKIIKFEAWTKPYWGNHIVWGRRITYRMKNGPDVVRTHGTLSGTYELLNLREGEYITQVQWSFGKFVDDIRLCLTGACTGWWGGSGVSYRKNKYANGTITSKWLMRVLCTNCHNGGSKISNLFFVLFSFLRN